MVQKPDYRPGSQYDDDWKPANQASDPVVPSANENDSPEGRTSRTASPESLKAAEESGLTPAATAADGTESDQIGEGFKDADGKGRRRFLGRFSKRQKMVGGGVIGLVGGTGIVAILFFTPLLRLESYMQRINQRAFAFAASAVEARMGHLIDMYMVKHIANLQSCGAVSSIDCRADYSNQGIAANLFNSWRDVRIEEKVFDRMGFTVESTRNPSSQQGVHKFTLRDRRGQSITFSGVEDWETFKAGRFTGGSREFGRELRRVLKEETKWHEVMHRRSVRQYLTRKHNVRLWCFFACKTRDSIELKSADAKTRYKYRFIERFVYPFSPKYGFIMNCIMQGGDCNPTDAQKELLDRSRLSDDDTAQIINDFTDDDGSRRTDRRLLSYGVERLITRLTNREVARRAVGAVPIAGQIYLGAWAFDMIYQADSFVENNGLSKLAADLNAAQYLEFYVGMRSMNDEMKSHVLSVEEVGAVLSDFEGAEESLVYQAYDTSRPRQSASIFGGASTYAQTPTSDDDAPYNCADGQPVDEGDYVCEEKKIARTFRLEELRANRVADGISDEMFSLYERCIGITAPDAIPVIGGDCVPARLKDVVQGAIGVVEGISDLLEPVIAAGAALLQHTPVGSLIDLMKNAVTTLFAHFFEKIFPMPIDIDSPGREKYDALEAGADVAASQFGEGGYTESGEPYGLGAPILSDAEAATIYKDYIAQQEYEYSHDDLIGRLTNLENPNSLISKAVRTAPASPETGLEAIASGVLRTFSNLGTLLTSLFSPRISAQNASQQQLAINAFGVTRYGYTPDDPAIARDPAELTPEYCESAKAERENTKTVNPVTGFDEYALADPCLLEHVVVEAGGAAFTND